MYMWKFLPYSAFEVNICTFLPPSTTRYTPNAPACAVCSIKKAADAHARLPLLGRKSPLICLIRQVNFQRDLFLSQHAVYQSVRMLRRSFFPQDHVRGKCAPALPRGNADVF